MIGAVLPQALNSCASRFPLAIFLLQPVVVCQKVILKACGFVAGASGESFADASAKQSCAIPTVHREVALSTLSGESHGLMVGGGGLAKRGQVATHTFGGKSKAIELADGANLMTGVAVYGCVSTDQRKSILMLIDVVNGNLPAIAVVAEFALRTILATVQVSVAILALCGGIAEIKILMAIDALHFRVPAAQRKLCLRVVELKFGAQWLPALCSVTLLARNLELIAMRAVNRSIWCDLLPKGNTRR